VERGLLPQSWTKKTLGIAWRGFCTELFVALSAIAVPSRGVPHSLRI
jgi:hypothetical protein